MTNNQQDREAVARIIDPAAWSEREGFIRRQMRDWQYNADVVVEKSLAAADAIIALLTSDTEHASPGAAEAVQADHLAKFERAIRLADTLASDVPITTAARAHITDAYDALAAARAALPAPEQPAQASEVERLPRLTRAMIAAACAGHFGKRATDQLGIEGIDLTADGRNWTFEQGFRRMWRGIAKHLATHPSTGERA